MAGGSGFAWFHGRLGGWYKDDPRQLRMLGRESGHEKVSDMRRIECSPEKPHPHV
jgi:hypothetical protein